MIYKYVGVVYVRVNVHVYINLHVLDDYCILLYRYILTYICNLINVYTLYVHTLYVGLCESVLCTPTTVLIYTP